MTRSSDTAATLAPASRPRVAPDGRPTGIGRMRFLMNPRWLALIAGAIAFCIGCYLLLAPWQFGRNDQRSAQNAAITSAQSAAPVPVRQLMSITSEPDPSARWHRVSVTGVFDTSREAYVRLRQNNAGSPASEVVLPLVLSDRTVVLVDRGYVAATAVSSGLSIPSVPSGQVTVTGRVQQDETDPDNRPPNPAPDGRTQFYAVNSAAIAGPGPQVLRGFIQLTDDSPGVLDPIGMPQIDSGPFLAYAWQWLTFGAMALFGVGFFIYREITDPRDPEEPDDTGDPGDTGDTADPGGTGDTADPDDTADPEGPANAQDLASPPARAVIGEAQDTQAASGADDVTVGGEARHANKRSRPRRGFDKSQLYD